jgi:polyisoprenoid-binding protein YceI
MNASTLYKYLKQRKMADMKKWVLDPTHSELLFKVKHLMITNVKGEFTDFSAEIKANGRDFENAKVNATIKSN